MASHQRTHTRNPGPSASSTSPSTNGSQTILQTEPQPGPSNIPNATLRLRGVSPSHQTSSSASQRVQWADDVVDNEGMGKKSSKVCCIYHKPREPGDSSSDSDSSSGSDGESEGEDLSRAQRAGGKGKGKGKGKGGRGRKDDGDGKADRKPSPNAYERVPKHSHRYEHKGKKEG